MQRQRGELVPVAEVIADLDGPVKLIREASPQARHHFTRFDQVNQLVSASEADPDLGFMARMLVLCSLPRIIEQFRQLPVLDRAAIEKLFGLKHRQAIQLLHRFGGYQVGRTFLVDRQELVEQLDALRDGETFRYEQRRRLDVERKPSLGDRSAS